MIQGNELRIGNLVYTINRNNEVHLPNEIPFKIMEISEIDVRGYLEGTPIHKVLKYSDLSIRDIDGIPLSVEWLVKFGFKIDFDANEFQFNGGFTEFTLSKTTSGGFRCYEIKLDGFLIIKYVHHLQNLFYCLTGRELQFVSTE